MRKAQDNPKQKQQLQQNLTIDSESSSPNRVSLIFNQTISPSRDTSYQNTLIQSNLNNFNSINSQNKSKIRQSAGQQQILNTFQSKTQKSVSRTRNSQNTQLINEQQTSSKIINSERRNRQEKRLQLQTTGTHQQQFASNLLGNGMTTVSSKGSNSNITVAQSTNRSHSRNQNNLNNVSNNLGQTLLGNINNTLSSNSPMRLGVLINQNQTMKESIQEQWHIRDQLLLKTLKDILNFITMNKTLLKYCNKEGGLDTGESGSYSLKMIIMQIKQKCEKLIQIENILHIKQLKLRNVLLKLGYDNPDDFIDEQELMNKYNSEQINQLMQENEHIQTQNLQLNEESKTTIQELQDKITELETQNFQLQTKFQSQLQSLTTRESQILLQEQKLQKQLSRAKENQNKKQEQMRQLEGQFQLNQKIYDEYIGQINSKESEMKLRDDKIRQIEVDMKNRMQIVEQKERDLQVLRQQIISADKSEEFQNQHDQLDQKLTKLAKQDLEFTQLEQAQKLHNQRETRIQEQERQIKAQKNQLFKSYDILTEKIYDFERECDKLRNKKRQFLIQQQKFNLTISQKYEELEKQKLGVIESEYKSKQMIKQQQQLY